MDLTPQQRKFADHFIQHSNAREAYRFAYPKPVKSDGVVDAAASRLLSNVKVHAYITKVQEELKKENKVTVERVVNKLVEEAFGVSINDLAELDERGKLQLKPGGDLNAVDGISFSESWGDKASSRSVSLKRKDNLKALDMLCKVLGIGAYGQRNDDNQRVFESNAGRVLDAVKRLKGKERS